MSTISEAFVSIRPKTDRFADEAQRGILGGKAKFLATGAVLGAAVVAGAGAALAGIGNQFHQAFSTLRVGTGATGEALDRLKDDFRAVVRDVPTDFDSASTAVADLNTRLGLTGEPLQKLSGQFLDLARITGGDVAAQIQLGTRVFGDWDVATEHQAETLDKLFRAAQASGAGVEDLMGKVVQFGAPLRGMGFGLEESVAMFAKFEQEGVNAELVIGSLRQGLGRMARAGEDAPATFRRIVDEISGMESRTEATAVAMELFGARAGPDMAAAIQEGRFELGAMLKAIEGGTDTIDAAARDTEGMSEAWQRFKNQGLLLLEPVATRVFRFLADALTNWVLPAMASLTAWWDRDGPTIVANAQALWRGVKSAFDGVAAVVATVIAWFQRTRDTADSAFGDVRKVADQVWPHVSGIVEASVGIIREVVQGTLTFVRAFWDRWGQTIMRLTRTLWDTISGVVQGALRFIHGVLDLFLGLIRGDWSRAWDGIKNILGGVWDVMRALVSGALRAVWDMVRGVMRDVFTSWRTSWDGIRGFLADAWDRIKEAVKNGIEAVHTWFRELPGKIADLLSGLPQRLFSIGKAALKQLAEGIKDFDLWGAIKGVFDKVVDRIKSFFGIGSPSKMFENMGRNIVSGFVKGLLSDHASINAAAQKLASAAGVQQHAAVHAAVRGGGLAATQGLNPQFLQRFNEYNRALGGILRIVSGFRSSAQQAILYARYLAGTGNLAAPPGRSMHERGLAIDHAPRSTAAMRNVARRFRLHYPVPGEPWHVEPFFSGASFNRPTILNDALVGERGTEHLLREDQIVDLMRQAMGGDQPGMVNNFHGVRESEMVAELERQERIKDTRRRARSGR